ncbi:MAG: PTS sugar transporter subunit IIA [bacterium]
MVGCLVISHGKIADAVVEASRRIAGECEQLFTMDCEDLAPKEIYEQIAHLIESKNLKDGLFVLVALKGGSFWHAAARIAHECDRVEVISGFNLSTVLSFITKRNQYTFEQLAEVLVTDAVRGISRFKKSKPGAT